MINWNHDIAAAPRDGRELLLAVRNTLGTAYGGDGEKLHPQWPFLYYIAKWNSDRKVWETTETEWDEHHCLDKYSEPCAWAEINAPFATGGIVSSGPAIPALVDREHPSAASIGVEIEITPAMMDAGIDAFGDYEPGWEPLLDVLERVFVAMMRSARMTVTSSPIRPPKITP